MSSWVSNPPPGPNRRGGPTTTFPGPSAGVGRGLHLPAEQAGRAVGQQVATDRIEAHEQARFHVELADLQARGQVNQGHAVAVADGEYPAGRVDGHAATLGTLRGGGLGHQGTQHRTWLQGVESDPLLVDQAVILPAVLDETAQRKPVRGTQQHLARVRMPDDLAACPATLAMQQLPRQVDGHGRFAALLIAQDAGEFPGRHIPEIDGVAVPAADGQGPAVRMPDRADGALLVVQVGCLEPGLEVEHQDVVALRRTVGPIGDG